MNVIYESIHIEIGGLTMTDTEWLTLMKKSPQQAHRALIKEYGSLVYVIVVSKIGNCAVREEIEDYVSDAFVEIFRCLDKFDSGKGTLKTFVSTIAKRTAINAFSYITYRRRTTKSMEDGEFEIPSPADDPEEETQKKLLCKRLWEIVESLGEPDASIIVYQYFYDMTVREIAKKLSMTSGAVQKRSIRARKQIKKILISENYFM